MMGYGLNCPSADDRDDGARGVEGRDSVDDTRQWEGPERRTSLRLRALIDDMQLQLRDTRHALEFLREGVSDLRVDVEELRRAHNEGRQSVAPPRRGRQG